ncbi:MAG: hypothetical protein JEZ07_04180 [Phycisphaerae bacterium]|nr:hypothetical protein [Phycisphaerae bacterium]
MQKIGKSYIVGLSVARKSIFWGVFFFYFLLIIRPELLYHSLGRMNSWPRFMVSKEFFWETICNCGGLLVYLSALFSLCMSLPWLGTLFITLIGLACWWVGKTVLGKSIFKGIWILAYLPSLSIIFLYNRYSNLMTELLGLAISLVFLAIYTKCLFAKQYKRICIFGGIFVLMMIIAKEYCIYFAILAGIFEMLHSKNRIVGFCYCIIGMIIYGAGYNFYGWSANFLDINYLSTKTDRALLYLIYSLYIYFLVLIGLGSVSIRKTGEDKKKSKYVSGKIVLYFCEFIVLAGLSWIIHNQQYISQKALLESGYMSWNRDWEGILLTAKERPPVLYNILRYYDINKALYETNRLPEEMFNYPQDKQSLVLIEEEGIFQEVKNEIYFRRIELLIELGNIGVAEKLAYELLVNVGEHPLILSQLALIHLAKGEEETASYFLNKYKYVWKLGTEMEYVGLKEWHICEEEGIEVLTKSDIVQQAQKNRYPINDVFGKYSLSNYYSELLKKNPCNRKAYDYMMASLLLDKKLDEFAGCLPDLTRFGVKQLPRHYQEALAIYLQSRGMKDIKRWGIQPEYLHQANTFLQSFVKCKKDRDLAGQMLLKDFGNTYYYYFMFATVGEQK